MIAWRAKHAGACRSSWQHRRGRCSLSPCTRAEAISLEPVRFPRAYVKPIADKVFHASRGRPTPFPPRRTGPTSAGTRRVTGGFGHKRVVGISSIRHTCEHLRSLARTFDASGTAIPYVARCKLPPTTALHMAAQTQYWQCLRFAYRHRHSASAHRGPCFCVMPRLPEGCGLPLSVAFLAKEPSGVRKGRYRCRWVLPTAIQTAHCKGHTGDLRHRDTSAS